MAMESAVWPLDVSTLVGSGFVARVLLLALVERLRRTFVSQQELSGLDDRLKALQGHYLQVRETADEARERARANQAEQEHQWERIAEQVIRPLERITERLEAVCEAQAAQAAALDFIGKRLDEADGRRKPRTSPTRRQP
jgi:hypothetical protein